MTVRNRRFLPNIQFVFPNGAGCTIMGICDKLKDRKQQFSKKYKE